MNHQILIASYHKDFVWLDYCLRSIEKFAKGFLLPVVAVDSSELSEAVARFSSRALVKPFDGPGFGRAQAAMMSGDLLCPDADYVCLWGSDFLARSEFTPDHYWQGFRKPIMYFQRWDVLAKTHPQVLFWKPGVEKALGGVSVNEFMRSPAHLIYPKVLYRLTRDLIERNTGMPFNDYVFHAVNREKNFSESNVLGEAAWRCAAGEYSWHDLSGLPWPERSPLIQFWSHGGLDRPMDRYGETRTPRDIIKETLGCV